MKKTSDKVTRQRRSKGESTHHNLERLSKRVPTEDSPFETRDGAGRPFSGHPYRKIIE